MRQRVTAVIAGLLVFAGLTSVMMVRSDRIVVVVGDRAVDGGEPVCRKGQMTKDEQHADTAPGAAGTNC